MLRRILMAAALAALPPAVAPSAALGGTVETVANHLDFTVSMGEASEVTVTSGSGQLMVTESGTMATLGTSDPACTSDSGPPEVVACPAAGITKLMLREPGRRAYEHDRAARRGVRS
jgi:hypothetical protein